MTNKKELYVSTEGSDSNDGSQASPFLTIERARRAVGNINDNMTGDIIVNIAPGDYSITDTIQMTTSDSGTNGYEVIYRCSGTPGSARLIGGEIVGGDAISADWMPATEDDVTSYNLAADMVGKVYKLQLDPDTYNFNTLYVNGRRAMMARTLNWEDTDRFPAGKDEYMFAPSGSRYSIAYPQDILPQSMVTGMKNAIARGEEAAQVYGWDWDYRNWFTSTIQVTSISENWLNFFQDPNNPVRNRPKYDFVSGARFYLQGNLAFLDVPGEYHYNKKTGTLYYYPNAGEENLSEQEVIVPVVREIFHLEGENKEKVGDVPNPDKQVHNITFQGVQAGYTEYMDSYSSGWNAFDDFGGCGVYPEEALQDGITQPSYCEMTEREENRFGVFTLLKTNNITLDAVQLLNTGFMGLCAWGDNDHITIQNSEFGYLGFHGINIDGGYPGPNSGKYSYGHLVTNNIIHDMGNLVGHGTGIQALQLHDSEFSHMEIYNAPRRAIFLDGAWANRTDKDANFNRYRDTATYENHFEYLYLHDLQQDGGDDGAFFTCTLYGSWGDASGSKPNYINQLYMNNVGSPSSNHDYKPNCMNFDMGCAGMIVSNMKAVNPQHYNYLMGSDVEATNVNGDYYQRNNPERFYKNFDDSLMEYDLIGTNVSFPYPCAVTAFAEKEYSDVYYREEFDNGLGDWWSLCGITETTPIYYSDNDWCGNSFMADAFYQYSAEGCRIGKPFGVDLNKIVEIDFFDHMCDGMENGYCGQSLNYFLNSFARVDNGTVQRAIGVDHSASAEYYAYKIGSLTRTSDVKREYGWHTFKWDYADGTNVKMYIDGELIATAASENFSYIEMGDYGASGFNAYDNVVIYGGDPADAPLPLPESPEKEMRE